jgi:hypothetical protein
MKVKFRDVMCMGNKTYKAGEDVEVSDISGQQLIDRGDAELVKDDDSSVKAKAAKKPATKEE